MRQLISRNPSDTGSVFDDQPSYIVKLDKGRPERWAFKADKNGTLTLVAGEPLMTLDGEEVWQSREEDLTLLHDVHMVTTHEIRGPVVINIGGIPRLYEPTVSVTMPIMLLRSIVWRREAKVL